MNVFARMSGAIALSLSVTACSVEPQGTALIADPLEPVNRVSHQINIGLDTLLIRPVSVAYGGLPSLMQTGLANFAGNLTLPVSFVNAVLQGDADGAGQTFGRFVTNSTFGLGGVLDPATEMGLIGRDTGFGDTLAAWGVDEGVYVVVPAYGPSTARDTIGLVVDVLSNPLRLADFPQEQVRTAGTVVNVIDLRAEFGETLDNVLYESDDSYTSTQILYIQRRRGQLQTGPTGAEDLIDLYE